ncbi:hypothetical protein LOTGIDRAFT_152108 [Lottia gigantea]|uniref:C-type lectin domain-containing protein n=1 Tax=Lottia gigantea TaxID=225164 RepID=V4AM58_LOTGI|nr:hypothetical protein LOTGIDRAFT_152108 [Lottia gigantea]ESP05279.1 hypothetical protein LOTGIDRAFT_152108 [Lottia gigantea]
MRNWNYNITDMIFPMLYLCMIPNAIASNTTCSDLVYMKIKYNATLIYGYSGFSSSIASVRKCLELCRDDVLCKSVGIDTSKMDCYLYDGRVYAGLPGTVNTDMIYYWQLEVECPVHLGNSEDSTSKIYIECPVHLGNSEDPTSNKYTECPIHRGYSQDPISKICSKFYSDIVNWTHAQEICEMDGGHLFVADTTEKIAILRAQYLIGATDILQEDDWNWLNGVPVDENLFASTQPSNTRDDEHCLAKYRSGLNDVPCHAGFKFICEVPTNIAFNQ